VGKQKCPKCERPMEMYYTPWCPYCDKPERRTVTTLNMIQCLRHIEAITGDEGYKRRVWVWLCDLGVVHNDTATGVPVDWSGLDDPCQTDHMTPQVVADLKLLRDTFGLTEEEHLSFEFSW
jgi:hypothetical protein